MIKYFTFILILITSLTFSQTITKIHKYNEYSSDYKIIKHYPDLVDSILTIEMYLNDTTSKVKLNVYQDQYLMKKITVDSILTKGYYSLTISIPELYAGNYTYSIYIYDLYDNEVLYKNYKIYKVPVKQPEKITQTKYPKYETTTYQRLKFGIGIGITVANTKNSPIGLNITSFIGDFFWDISFNGASGDGEYLEFKSSKTYQKKNTVSWIATNIGFIINIQDNVNIIPTIGYVIKQNIYNDPIGWNTWYKENNNSNASVGTMLLIKNPSFFIIAGINTFEVCKLAVGFIL